jgi:hypothetical protein
MVERVGSVGSVTEVLVDVFLFCPPVPFAFVRLILAFVRVILLFELLSEGVWIFGAWIWTVGVLTSTAAAGVASEHARISVAILPSSTPRGMFCMRTS